MIEQLRSETRRLERLLDHEQRQRTDERGERERERQSERERGERQDAMIAGLLAEQTKLTRERGGTREGETSKKIPAFPVETLTENRKSS